MRKLRRHGLASSATHSGTTSDLQRAVNEAGASSIDLTRVLEEFLKKYPNATQIKEIERALAKAAIDDKDDGRTEKYGEHALASSPDDMLMLDRVARAELTISGKENAARAFALARRFQELVEKLPEPAGVGEAKLVEERYPEESRGRCSINRTPNPRWAILTRRGSWRRCSFSKYPCEESAREWAGRRWNWRVMTSRPCCISPMRL